MDSEENAPRFPVQDAVEPILRKQQRLKAINQFIEAMKETDVTICLNRPDNFLAGDYDLITMSASQFR